MESWIIFSTLSVLAVSFLMAFQKIPSLKKIDKYQFNAAVSFFAALLSFLFLFSHINFKSGAILYAAIWGASFSILNLMQMHALHKSTTSNVFPFTSLLSNIFVVIGGVLFLQDKVTLLQFVAILLAITLMFYSTYKGKVNIVADILPLFFSIAIISAFSKFIQKFGATNSEIYNFIFWELLFCFIFSAAFMFYNRKSFSIGSLSKNTFNYGVISGVFSFLTTLLVVKALETGPISLVYIIIGTYTFFTSLIAHFIFKESLTRKNIVFILISILIILLIKLG